MFRLFDDFRSCDQNRQPYCFSIERHTQTQNLHAGVCEDGFHFKSIGNRHILNTPAFSRGCFRTVLRMNHMAEFSPRFTVFFQYDPATRSGLGLRLCCGLNGTLEMALVSVEGTLVKVLNSLSFPDTPIGEMEWVPLEIERTAAQVRCAAAGRAAAFSCDDAPGVIAIERDNFIGELILQSVAFESEEDFETETLLPEIVVDIPCTNGGDIPYRVSWQVERIQRKLYLRCALDGGTKTRPVNREDRMGQYVAEKDWMTNPYAGIRSAGEESLFRLLMGENAFIDPNIYWDCQKGFFGDTRLPVELFVQLPHSALSDDAQLIFGYEYLICTGYGGQAGGHEFRFDRQGKLRYSGAALDGSDQWEVLSPEDKFAISLIPEDTWHREEVVEHLKYNHYFEVSEDIRFKLQFRTLVDTDYLSAEARILDVFEDQVLQTAEVTVSACPWLDGYNCLEAAAAFAPMALGVYKIEFRVLYGGKLRQRIVHAFEVFNKDTDENPALATGLPFAFSMPNEQKWLMRNSFDLWSPARSCDVEHFITCITDTPIEAETRRVWELTKPFKREWFAWLARRTCNDYLDSRHDIVRQKADYLYYGIENGVDDWLSNGSVFPFGGGLFWEYFAVNMPMQRKCLREFLEENPGVAEDIGYEGDEKDVSRDVFVRLMQRWGHAWRKKVCDEILAIFREQNRQLALENPGVRRAMYSHISQYTAPTTTYWAGALQGHPNDETIYKDVFTGFAILEDYPYSCAYQTYRGPFTAMTVMLHTPQLRLYPEQYSGSKGGCIDGAVKFAHAPMGAYNLPAYRNSTHAFEYVFNTPYRTAEGFRYWDHYGFHRTNYTSPFMDQLIRDWKYVVRYQPKKPLRTLGFVTDFDTCDDAFVVFPKEEADTYAWVNRSESGSGLLHDCSREAGLPNGFALKLETLKDLDPGECDLLVLPSLKNASQEAKDAIRQIWAAGVNLIALSHVDGLEDIFGVAEAPVQATVRSLSWNGETEAVFPMEGSFLYGPDTARVAAWANETLPAVLVTERTALINAQVTSLGACDQRKPAEPVGIHVTGRLIRACLTEQLHRLSKPLVLGENVGTTLFETKAGKTVLMAIDYSPFDNRPEETKEAVVQVRLPGIREAACDRDLFVGKKSGQVQELRFAIAPHETVFIELN